LEVLIKEVNQVKSIQQKHLPKSLSNAVA